jgi:hypothetical protein
MQQCFIENARLFSLPRKLRSFAMFHLFVHGLHSSSYLLSSDILLPVLQTHFLCHSGSDSGSGSSVVRERDLVEDGVDGTEDLQT